MTPPDFACGSHVLALAMKCFLRSLRLSFHTHLELLKICVGFAVGEPKAPSHVEIQWQKEKLCKCFIRGERSIKLFNGCSKNQIIISALCNMKPIVARATILLPAPTPGYVDPSGNNPSTFLSERHVLSLQIQTHELQRIPEVDAELQGIRDKIVQI